MNKNHTQGSPVALNCSDKNVVHSLYERMGRAALSKTLRLVGRVEVAQDLVQEVFLRLWDRQPVFYSELAAYQWIYKSCHHAAIDYLRLASSKREISGESVLDCALFDTYSGSSIDAVFSNRQLIETALKNLSKREQEIFFYRIVDEMTQEEIAEFLGISRRTVIRDLEAIGQKLALPLAVHKLEGLKERKGGDVL